VLNNAPSSDVLGSNRNVDPIPDSGSMVFVFEDDASKQVLQGQATPSRSRLQDFIAGAELSAADYAKNRALADKPEDVVMVPLTFTNDTGKKKDFSGLLSGTTNFNIGKEDRLTLQDLTEKATQANIAQRAAPQANDFASVSDMLMSMRREDLALMAKDNFPGAVEALGFRDTIVADVTKLEAMVSGGAGAATPDLLAALQRMQALTDGDKDRIAFIGREMNRSGKLDALIANLCAAPLAQPSLVQAAATVSDSLAAQTQARAVLRAVIYPKMVRESPNGVAGTILRQADNRLRHAQSPKDVNDTLDILTKQFAKKRLIDPGSDQDFVNALKPYRMKIGA
jgi:hypothetical protein